MYETDLLLYGILVFFGILFLIGIFSAVIRFFNGFTAELRYLNDEIRRTDGSEQRYWIKRRKKLWLSLLPFVRY